MKIHEYRDWIKIVYFAHSRPLPFRKIIKQSWYKPVNIHAAFLKKETVGSTHFKVYAYRSGITIFAILYNNNKERLFLAEKIIKRQFPPRKNKI